MNLESGDPDPLDFTVVVPPKLPLSLGECEEKTQKILCNLPIVSDKYPASLFPY